MSRTLLVAISLVVCAAVGFGIAVVGGPEYARALKADKTLIRTLSTVQKSLKCADAGFVLPDTLDDRGECRARTITFLPNIDEALLTYTRYSDHRYAICGTLSKYWREHWDQRPFTQRPIPHVQVTDDGVAEACFGSERRGSIWFSFVPKTL